MEINFTITDNFLPVFGCRLLVLLFFFLELYYILEILYSWNNLFTKLLIILGTSLCLGSVQVHCYTDWPTIKINNILKINIITLIPVIIFYDDLTMDARSRFFDDLIVTRREIEDYRFRPPTGDDWRSKVTAIVNWLTNWFTYQKLLTFILLFSSSNHTDKSTCFGSRWRSFSDLDLLFLILRWF